jgi:hypothetical protein
MNARCEVFAGVLLRIQVFWDVMLCCQESDSCVLKGCSADAVECLTLE